MAFWQKKRNTDPSTLEQTVKIRGGSRYRQLSGDNRYGLPNGRRNPPRGWEPRGLIRVMSSSTDAGGGSGQFGYTGGNRSEFYRWLRDSIPIISAGVWAWVRLTATPMTQIIEGSASERRKAERALQDLEQRVLPPPFGQCAGLQRLTEGYLLELFTIGRFAGEAVIRPDFKGIDHFQFLESGQIEWKTEGNLWVPVYTDKENKARAIDPDLFFRGALCMDLNHPEGIPPLSCIPFVSEIEQLMLEDMARSSHNAGTPRMQIKVTRPERFNWEDDQDYSNRVNSYFDAVVREFQNLEPDDNVFSWNDVEVAIIGQSGIGYNWRLAREQIIEDVVTGLKLFPWVLGRTHKTTQNWVQSQFDLLMEMARTYQQTGAALADWLCNLELKRLGIFARVYHRFDHLPDPFRLDRARAVEIELRNIDLKVQRGYISKQEGAQEMGYLEAFKED
ncbi:MAG: hypothetical protein V2A61_03185 [Calditrichota bacterium]